MKAFIMAQGQGSRWEKSRKFTDEPPCEYKQALPITEDLNLISRTIRQFKFCDPLVICAGDMRKYLPEGTPIMSLREPTRCLLHGIWDTKGEWKDYDRLLFLLGDVAFSNQAVEEILDYDGKFAFFGRLGENKVTGKEAREIFAISVWWKEFEAFERRLARLYFGDKGEKLWDYFWEYAPTFIDIDDYTDDTDSLLAYNRFWPKMKEAIIKDDENYEA